MSVDDAIEKIIGPSGKYQTWVLILTTISRLPTEYQLTNVVFILPSVDFVCLDNNTNLTNFCPCENPQYVESTIVNSVTSEFNLICGRTALSSLTQSMLQIGILLGSLIYGYVSDRYGRKLAIVLSLFLSAAFSVISGLVPQLWMFLVVRFLIGTAVGGTMLCTYTLLIELCGKSFRPYLVGLFELSYVLGYLTIPIFAYFIRDWRNLQLATSVPWLLVILCHWLIPESPRWLITVGKKKEAVEILTKIAKKNNRPTDNIEIIVDEYGQESQNSKQQTGSYLDLFKTPKIRFYTIINAFVWMFCAHTFFGINQYIGRLDGDLYLNVIISALFLFPGLIFVVVATIYLKRKITVIISFAVAAISLYVFLIIPSHLKSVILAFAIIGQTGIYAAFVLIYLYSAEVFPTIIRNSALGFASVFARVGSFVAPFVVNIGIEWLSIFIFGSLSLLAAVLCSFLPETKDTILLNTIEQTEMTKKKGNAVI